MSTSSDSPTPPEDLSVSDWLIALKQGETDAAAELWKRIEPRLKSLARRRLGGAPVATYDEDDLANSVLNALCAGARAGRFERMESRDDLWRLLSTILSRKASNRRRYHQARPEWGESRLGSQAVEAGLDLLADVREEEWTDTLGVECEELIERLEPKLRRVALMKLEGHTNEEIAERIGRAPRSVTRYVDLIRENWARD